MINNPGLVPSRQVFLRVAREIFSDGVFNWGRVVALFYFACRLVIKVSASIAIIDLNVWLFFVDLTLSLLVLKGILVNKNTNVFNYIVNL